jgi:hypothetical protein
MVNYKIPGSSEYKEFFFNYLYYFIFLSICFYILFKLIDKSKNQTVNMELKIIMYIIIFYVLMFIFDILSQQEKCLNRFIYILLFTFLMTFLITYLIIHFYPECGYYNKMLMIIAFIIILVLVVGGVIYYMFEMNCMDDTNNKIYSLFNKSYKNNSSFLIFMIILLLIFKSIYDSLSSDTNLSDFITPCVLGIVLIFFIFSFLIYLCEKLGVIRKTQYLNTFIVLSSILFFLIIFLLYLFIDSIYTICKNNQEPQSDKKDKTNTEIIGIVIVIAIFMLLWYDDARNWHQSGYILFILITLFMVFITFNYATTHPDVGLLSTWLFIEWLILITYRSNDSKNSFNYAFIKV